MTPSSINQLCDLMRETSFAILPLSLFAFLVLFVAVPSVPFVRDFL
jgi:hypothetical protein